MPTPIFLTGWEHGVATLVTSGGGLANFVSNAATITVSNTQAHSGTYALKISPNGTDDAYYRITVTGSPNTIVGRFYFYVDTEPAAASMIFDTTWVTATVGSNTNPGIYIDPSANTVQIRSGSGTVVATSSNTYTVGQWHYVDFSFNLSANPWVLKAKLDGGTEFSGGPALSADTAVNLRFGKDNAPAMTVYMDDAFISATGGDYPIGAGGTEALVPTADGTHNAGTNVMEDNTGADINGTTVTAFSKINSIPPSSTTYIRQAANGTGNYVEVTFGNITATHSAILGAAGFLTYTSETTTSNRGACMISKDAFSSFTEVRGTNTTTVDYSDGSTAAPFYNRAIISGVVDDTTVNALSARMGFSGDATPDPYWIDLLVEVAYSISSGTMTPQSVSGGITPSGAIAKTANKAFTGGITPQGVLSKLTSKTFAGGVTPTGAISKQGQKILGGGITPTGNLTTSRIFAAILAGAITPSGSILKMGQKPLGSIITPTGTLGKLPNKSLDGNVTSTGSLSKHISRALSGAITSIVGTLQATKTALKSLEGTLTSTGTATKQTNKTLAGGATPTGAISKQINKALTGAITSITGVLEATKTALISLGGTLTSSGTIIKQTGKNLGSIITPSGSLTKETLKFLGSIINPTGSISKQTGKAASGEITPTGSTTRLPNKTLAGDVIPSGTILKQSNKTVAGSITPSGNLLKTTLKFLGGVLTTVGTLSADFISGVGDTFFQSVGGTLDLAGTIQKSVSKFLGGSITPSAVLSKITNKLLSGSATPTGTVSRVIGKLLSGEITLAGVVTGASAFLISLAGTLTASGTVSRQAGKSLTSNVTFQGTISRSISKFVSGNLISAGQVVKKIFRELSGILSGSGILGRIFNLPPPSIPRIYLRGSVDLEVSLQGNVEETIRLSGTRHLYENLQGQK